MATLLLRLAGPLQAWGCECKFETRRTERLPTKSGVVGMLAAALGRKRDADLSDLNALRFGVRVEQEGTVLRDYHTAKSEKSAYVTERYYLEDAVFLVGLEGDADLLSQLAQALQSPAFPLFLGRRSCPPTLPIVLETKEEPLLSALQSYPWQAAEWWQEKHHRGELRLVTDALAGSGAAVKDVPLSFNPTHRRYSWRNVQEHRPVSVNDGTAAAQMEMVQTEHDPFGEL